MDDITLEAVIDLLKDVNEAPDYSFDILSIVSAIDDEFDVAVPAKEIVPANFNSAKAIHAMICRLAAED